MQPASWEVANRRTYVPTPRRSTTSWSSVCPLTSTTATAWAPHPIQMMQALSAQVIRHKRVMKENCVIICSSICNGYFHDERWPYLRELYELFQHDYMQVLPDMDRYGEYFATNEEYIRKYRFTNAFHPFHGFSHDELRPHRRDEHRRHLYRGRAGAGHRPRHGASRPAPPSRRPLRTPSASSPAPTRRYSPCPRPSSSAPSTCAWRTTTSATCKEARYA